MTTSKTKTTGTIKDLRAGWLATDYAIRRFAPLALRGFGRTETADRLEQLDPIASKADADAARALANHLAFSEPGSVAGVESDNAKAVLSAVSYVHGDDGAERFAGSIRNNQRVDRDALDRLVESMRAELSSL